MATCNWSWRTLACGILSTSSPSTESSRTAVRQSRLTARCFQFRSRRRLCDSAQPTRSSSSQSSRCWSRGTPSSRSGHYCRKRACRWCLPGTRAQHRSLSCTLRCPLSASGSHYYFGSCKALRRYRVLGSSDGSSMSRKARY